MIVTRPKKKRYKIVTRPKKNRYKKLLKARFSKNTQRLLLEEIMNSSNLFTSSMRVMVGSIKAASVSLNEFGLTLRGWREY